MQEVEGMEQVPSESVPRHSVLVDNQYRVHFYTDTLG